jgi:hypothetical protein
VVGKIILFFYSKTNNMRLAGVLNKLAFICNILFFVCLYLQRIKIDEANQQDAIKYIIILGWFISSPLNIILLLVHFSLRLKGKAILPKWLLYVNMAIFIFQVVYFLV